MILTRLRVHPFGCFTDKEVRFSAGMNVVLGPNEAGKSTLFRAIRHALFVTAKLKKGQHAEYLKPYLPAGGGDSIFVALEMEVDGKRWVLKRRWGARAASELTLPTGAPLADEPAIQEQLASILPARAATFTHVLMTGQAELANTISLLREKGKDALHDLADTLRQAVLQTGGVSPDRFQELLRKRHDAAFGRWDTEHGGPEGNRGIDNPWRNGVGLILRSWYEREDVGRRAREAALFERQLDQVNTGLRSVATELAAAQSFLSENRKAAEAARERRLLDAELGRVRTELEALVQVSKAWPASLQRAEELERSAVRRAAARAPLEKERRSAELAEEQRALRERLQRVERRAQEEGDAARRLAAVPALDRAALDAIRKAASAVEKLESSLEAGRLSIVVAARGKVQLSTQEDFEPERARRLEEGEVVRLRAGSRARLVHPDLEIEVRSGDPEADARAEKLASARRALAELLQGKGVSDPSQAEERFHAREKLSAELEAARKNLAEELGGETLESLRARGAELGPAVETRPLAALTAELATLKAEEAAEAQRLDELRQHLEQWQTAYESGDRVIQRLAEGKAREAELGSRLEKAVPVPAAFGDAQTFLSEYEAVQREQEELTEEKNRFTREKSVLEAKAPDQSAEELAVQHREAQSVFDRELRRGQALKRVMIITQSLLQDGDRGIYAGMRRDLERLLGVMTGGRHSRLEMDGSLPTAVAHPGDVMVPWEQLSTGTKDALALGIRLAMAAQLLGPADGFLLMDDPLVDMDPERQRKASLALKEFAAKKQLILFTCQPGTAALLGGNQVSL